MSRNSFVDFSEKIILSENSYTFAQARNIVTFRAHEIEKSVEHFSSYSKRERERKRHSEEEEEEEEEESVLVL